MTGGERHDTHVIRLGEGVTQAVCDCGWRSKRFGEDKRLGTMDALQAAQEAADLHQWDRSIADQ
ncbi:MAG TPA: hypothetical protein VKB75_10000 [Jatrophihabitans sp.]|nr:hypothetical protein [Jatrophihabitans sp.]